MNFEDDKEIYIDDKGKILIENAKKAISIDKSSSTRDDEIEKAMNELYEHFSSYSEEELEKFGLQLEIYKVERMLKNEFLPLKSKPMFDPNSEIKYPDEITSQQSCEQALDYIVYSTRKKLSEHHNLDTATLEKNCFDTSHRLEDVCKQKKIEFLHLGLNQNLEHGMFHHFTIVNFPLSNGETKKYLVDCTYRQFFTKSNSFIKRISAMRGPAKGSSIGAYMMMTEERKEIAEQLLTKGYIEATPENVKEYFDAIIFSGRDNEYYKQHNLDFMNPDDCIPRYSIDDYMEMLIQNHVMDENSFFREIEPSIQEERPDIETATIGKRTIEADTTDKSEVTTIFGKWKQRMIEMGILKE